MSEEAVQRAAVRKTARLFQCRHSLRKGESYHCVTEKEEQPRAGALNHLKRAANDVSLSHLRSYLRLLVFPTTFSSERSDTRSAVR